MDNTKCMTSSASLTPKAPIKNAPIISKSAILHQRQDTGCINLSIKKHPRVRLWLQKKKTPWMNHKIHVTKEGENVIKVEDKAVDGHGKKGTIAGEVALIIDTSIGSEILALPQKASPAEEEEEGELEVTSIRTMAQQTLGDWGGNLATISDVFLGYTSMIAYSSKSGDILFHLINLPEPVSGFLFTAIFTILISVGGTQTTDQANQWLTISMIVLCAYLGSDLTRLRASVLLGSTVPLLALFVWDAIALGLPTQPDQIVDPVELLTRYVKHRFL
ncbi:Vacuolar membrane ATPase 10 [Hibiscus syriacus]|uniref:Vacuolar membrane ATPase 10 n=1 Tax=Hibiscus syriacus TaxID=106335 RepID=A0A6A3AH52_HIBSY|nr:Vacuolar membrane ATPase 10 [Hibiscus syriacus]